MEQKTEVKQCKEVEVKERAKTDKEDRCSCGIVRWACKYPVCKR